MNLPSCNLVSCHLVSEPSQSSCFSLAADESTDISDIAPLSVFVRFFNGERLVEELFGLVPLYGRTTGEIIFNEISKLLATKTLMHRNLKQFLNDLDSEFKDVLLYNNERWLSKGQMLKRVWEFVDTSEKRDHFLNLLCNPNQLERLSFL
ncbi:hypothetical protein PR048_028544, partial [Dryococelus australis]